MTIQTGIDPLVPLHRYFIWTDRMKRHFEAVLAKVPTGDASRVNFFESNLYLSYWYGALYVVIEGWKELELIDPTVESYLISPNVDLLRRYRNGVFHFQKEYYDDRFKKFITDGEQSVAWVRGVHEAFSTYFLREIPSSRFSS